MPSETTMQKFHAVVKEAKAKAIRASYRNAYDVTGLPAFSPLPAPLLAPPPLEQRKDVKNER